MTSALRQANLISTDDLARQLNSPDLVVVDASWYLPAMNRDAKSEYLDRRIPGAVFFDLDDISVQNSPLPHMMPEAHIFASKIRKLGIGDGQRIVVYDGLGLFSAPRAWWMFRTMGARDVAVLDGGLAKWEAEGKEIDDLPPAPRLERHFTARKDNSVITDADRVAQALSEGSLVVDARSKERFEGVAEEPRPGVRSGHMPGSTNLPYSDLLNRDSTLKNNAEMEAAFRAVGWHPGRQTITSCGSGVTAAVLTFALTIIGEQNLGLYDGSWAEWGADPARAVKKS